ncbi:unnamed protein product [Closterium sp. NIES-64]|nr:unnamed protein product [Closterium sp. NIES-64]
MSHPADVLTPPKGQRPRPAADAMASPSAAGFPAMDQQSGSVNADKEVTKDNIPAVTAKLKGVDISIPGGSGLSVAEKAAMAEDGCMDEDSDDEMLIDLDKEAASRLHSVIILLIPMMLEKEVSSVIETVKALIKRGWYTDLFDGAAATTKFQELLPAYVAKTRFCRLQVSFVKESDALWVQKKEVVYQPLANMGQLVTLHWLHAEDLSYAREKAMNPLAIEVMIRSVSAAVELDMLHDRLATYKLKSTQKSAFQQCTCLHRVLHPVTGAETDVVKALVYAHLGSSCWIHAVADPADPASLKASSLMLPILHDPAIAFVSTGSSREDWICTQTGCGKAKGKSFMSEADHITVAAHLQQLEKPGSATKASLDRMNLTVIRKDYGV